MSSSSAVLNSYLQKARLPLFLAPMFLVSTVEWVMAGIRAGVFAAFPCTNARSMEDLKEAFETFQSLPEQLPPYAVNAIVHPSYARRKEEMELILHYQPKIVITALGSPKETVAQIHNYGGLVFADVNNLSHAQKAVAAGVDGLVLVCAGAGGHTGMLSPFVFVEQVRKFWTGPIILAGAISTGSTLKIAQLLGADLAYMGTRCIVAQESGAAMEYKQLLTKSTVEDLVLTPAITGVPAYFLQQSLLKAGWSPEQWTQGGKVDFSQMQSNTAKAWKDIWSAGQAVGNSTKIQPLQEIIDELEKDYLAFCKGLC